MKMLSTLAGIPSPLAVPLSSLVATIISTGTTLHRKFLVFICALIFLLFLLLLL
jgi:hypothetical protein